MGDKNLEERGVKALESIAESFQTIEDSILEIDFPMWSERLEWYLNEFFNIAKSRNVGASDRPVLDRERSSNTEESTDEVEVSGE
jgi:hypothetical protein|tara:strand:+ start:760 stop:1014 length:255 start_codon:yes stop_codon:yes gene_type:complete